MSYWIKFINVTYLQIFWCRVSENQNKILAHHNNVNINIVYLQST